jgi:hypothetical protein
MHYILVSKSITPFLFSRIWRVHADSAVDILNSNVHDSVDEYMSFSFHVFYVFYVFYGFLCI